MRSVKEAFEEYLSLNPRLSKDVVYTIITNEAVSYTHLDVYKRQDVFLSLGAQDTVCFGTDFDGAHVPEDIRDIGGIPRLYLSLIHI